jgi:hypothetical protein
MFQHRQTVQAALIAALASCAEGPLQLTVRDFLIGLSCDELQFIAEFLGASILEAEEKRRCSRGQLARQIAAFQRARTGYAAEPSPDQDHKMILLLEFLCRSGLQRAPAALRPWQA